ncbi:MAG: hypothetical protein WB995_05300, partial [Candidatus Acidiferrales bacterium]
MRLVTFEPSPNRKRIGAYGSGLRIVDLNLAYALYLRDVENEPAYYRLADARVPADMRGLFEGGDKSLDAARAALKFITDRGPETKGPSGEKIIYEPSDINIKAPIAPKKFFHTAGNFREHHEEA